MGQMKEEFSRLSSEYLLERRALGDELSAEAHAAIEEVFRERGEVLPPRPKAPIISNAASRDGRHASSSSSLSRNVAGVVLALIVGGIGNEIGHSWIGLLITAAILLYLVADWLRKSYLSPEQQEQEKNQRIAFEEGLTELMTSAADGAVGRVRDLLNYGHKPNARSSSGSTALMYAVRNDHAEVVRVLLTAGADPTLKSDKGIDCQALAARHAGAEIRALLREHVHAADA